MVSIQPRPAGLGRFNADCRPYIMIKLSTPLLTARFHGCLHMHLVTVNSEAHTVCCCVYTPSCANQHPYWLPGTWCRALKTKMSRSPAANKQFKMDITRFLDVVELERWLKEWRDSVMAYAGIHYSASEADAHVLPVFVFDVDTASKGKLQMRLVMQCNSFIPTYSRNTSAYLQMQVLVFLGPCQYT